MYHEPAVTLHSANPWGVYDIGVIDEYVWIEEVIDSDGCEYFESYIRLMGDLEPPKIPRETSNPESSRWHRHCTVEHCYRVVLPA